MYQSWRAWDGRSELVGVPEATPEALDNSYHLTEKNLKLIVYKDDQGNENCVAVYPDSATNEQIQNDFDTQVATQQAADEAAQQPTLERRVLELQQITNIYPIDTSTLEGAINNKLREIATSCQETIYSGLDIIDTKGTEHFSLTIEDQANLSALAMAIGTGLTSVPYHADGQLCRAFSADEFTNIYTKAKYFVAYNTTLCNHINVWVRRCTTMEEVNAITYTSILPDDLKANFDAIVATFNS